MLERRTLTSQAIVYILNLIKTGAVRPGEKLPTEKELTETLGVSRSCVREAMKALESLQLVRIRARIGATVLAPSATQLKKAEDFSVSVLANGSDVLLEFRKILEVGVASLAAEKADDSDIEAMQALLDKYTQSLKGHDIDNCADVSFHDALAAASKNPIAINAWKMTCTRLEQVYDRTKSVPNVGMITLRDHQRILRAIREHNPPKARAAMRAHLENVEKVWRIALAPEPASNSGARA